MQASQARATPLVDVAWYSPRERVTHKAFEAKSMMPESPQDVTIAHPVVRSSYPRGNGIPSRLEKNGKDVH